MLSKRQNQSFCVLALVLIFMQQVRRVWDFEHRNASDNLQALHAAILCASYGCIRWRF